VAFVSHRLWSAQHAYLEYCEVLSLYADTESESKAMREARRAVDAGPPSAIQPAVLAYLEGASKVPFRWVTWLDRGKKTWTGPLVSPALLQLAVTPPPTGVSLARGIITVDSTTQRVLSTRPIDSLSTQTLR
jgi:hypothetical protein